MKKVKDTFPVDAGNISIVDLHYIRSHGGLYGPTAETCCKLVSLDPGNYRVTIKIDDCWDGAINESFELETKGEVVIGDVCYLFSADEPSDSYWMGFLDSTEYLKDNNEFANFFSTGGDGTFEVEVTFEKLED